MTRMPPDKVNFVMNYRIFLAWILRDFNTMPEMNKNDEIYPEYIDICNVTYAIIRKDLIEAGSESSQLIINKFIRSDDVYVGNREYFVEHLRSWRVDLCH
jgi:hypothetical protein